MKLTTDVLNQIDAHIQENLREWVLQIAASQVREAAKAQESSLTGSAAQAGDAAQGEDAAVARKDPRTDAGLETVAGYAPTTWSSNAVDQQLVSRVSRVEDELGKTREQLVRVEEGLHNLDNRIREGFAAVDQRFAMVDQRFTMVDQRFATVDQRFAAVDQRLDRLFRVNMSLMAAGFSVISILIAYGTFLR